MEIDSFIPVEPRYEFLRKSCYKKMEDGSEGFRLKTAKFKKQLSQGLSLPLSLFPELKDVRLDDDVTEILGIKIYQSPIPAQLSGTIKGMFPGWIQKTDAERIQNLPDYFNEHKDIEFEETEKLDGSSCTVYFNDGEFGVCSRNLELKEDENNTLWRIAKDINIRDILKNIQKNVAIQGEVVGEGINKNSLKLIGQHFYIFDIYDIDKKRHMTPDERKEFIGLIKNDKLKHVPIINEKIKIFEINDTMEKMIEYAKGKSAISGEREGVIFKSCTLHGGNTISFKVVNNNYLLYEEG